MADEKVSNPEPTQFRGVAVDNPRIVEYTKNCYKNGVSVADAQRIIGMPKEVIEKIYNQEKAREKR